MSGWTKSAKFAQSTPRRTRGNKTFRFLLIFPAAIYLTIMVFSVVPTSYPLLHKMEILKARGISTEATILYLHEICGRKRCRFDAGYEFRTPPGNGFLYKTIQEINVYDYLALRIGETVPIVYDPTDLSRSALNFEDHCLRARVYCRTGWTLSIRHISLYGLSGANCRRRSQKPTEKMVEVSG
jgi:hypothetical protein